MKLHRFVTRKAALLLLILILILLLAVFLYSIFLLIVALLSLERGVHFLNQSATEMKNVFVRTLFIGDLVGA